MNNEFDGLHGLKKYMVFDALTVKIGYAACKNPKEAIEATVEHDIFTEFFLSTHAVLNSIDQWTYLQDGACRFVVTTDNKIVG